MDLHDIIELAAAALAIIGSYGGARAGISKALTLAQVAKESADRAHERIDALTEPGFVRARPRG